MHSKRARRRGRKGLGLTISKAPLTTPHNTFENHNPPSLASGGNSANSANGFSSNVSMNSCGAAFGVVGGGGGKERFGVIFKKVLNATYRQLHSSFIFPFG
jgi:hypothetical protein